MNNSEVIELDDWYSDAASTFGDRLAAARETLGLEQEDLAANLGVKLETLRDWENDVNDPRANKLQMLSGVLNVSISWLLTGAGEGVDGREGGLVSRAGAADIVAELQVLQSEMVAMSSRMRRLEKKLLSVIAA